MISRLLRRQGLTLQNFSAPDSGDPVILCQAPFAYHLESTSSNFAARAIQFFPPNNDNAAAAYVYTLDDQGGLNQDGGNPVGLYDAPTTVSFGPGDGINDSFRNCLALEITITARIKTVKDASAVSRFEIQIHFMDPQEDTWSVILPLTLNREGQVSSVTYDLPEYSVFTNCVIIGTLMDDVQVNIVAANLPD